MLKTLIVTENEEVGSLLKEKLEGLPGLGIKAELVNPSVAYDLAYDLAKESKPDILVLDLEAKGGEAWLALGETLFAQCPQLTLLVTAKEQEHRLILKAMRAGAKDFLSQPFNTVELSAIINRLVQRHVLEKKEPQNKRKVIAVFSNKGGTGVTTLATNLAVGLGRLESQRTALVDLVLQHGDTSTFLNITPAYTIVDVVNNLQRADSEFLKSTLTKHPCGIYVLVEPAKPEEADNITNAHIAELVAGLKETFDYVVLDSGHQFDARTIAALDAADIILVVFLLDLPTIRSTLRCLEILQRLGYSEEKVKLVLNRHSPKDAISLKEAQTTLGHPVYWSLPNDFDSVISAINQGQPVFDVAEHSQLSQSILKLVGAISGKVLSAGPLNEQKLKIWDKKKLLSFLKKFPQKE